MPQVGWARPVGTAVVEWAFFTDAFDNYCVSNRRQSEIVSKANQYSSSLEVGSEICAFPPGAGAVISTYFLFNFPSPSFFERSALFPKGSEGGRCFVKYFCKVIICLGPVQVSSVHQNAF